jgi:hypothetical protein
MPRRTAYLYIPVMLTAYGVDTLTIMGYDIYVMGHGHGMRAGKTLPSSAPDGRTDDDEHGP